MGPLRRPIRSITRAWNGRRLRRHRRTTSTKSRSSPKKPTTLCRTTSPRSWLKRRCPLAEHAPALAHQFSDLRQQREAAELGMWLFLATECMFFGGLFLAYFVYRHWYLNEFALGSRSMDVTLGSVNTAVLLTSSLTMALAVHSAHLSRRVALMRLLTVTMLLGVIFLAIKAYEYHLKYEAHLI